MVMQQAGQSFETGAALGAGRFISFKAFTKRKMQNATMMKLMMTLMKFP